MSATILKIDPYKVNFRILKITNTSKSLQNRKTQMFSQMIDQMEHKNKWYKVGLQTWCYKPHPTVHTLVTFSGRTLLGVRGFGLKILATDVLILDFTIYKKLLQPLQMRLDWVGSGLSMTIGGIKRLRDQAPN